MTIVRSFFVIIGILFCNTLFAQQASILTGKGLNKLSVFSGDWKEQNLPGSKDNTSAIYGCRFSENKNFIVCDQIVKRQGSETNNLSIYSYDSLNYYKLTLVGLPGIDPFSIPVISSGDTLIYPWNHIENGIKIYTRTLNIFLSNAKYEFFVQSSKDDIHWITSVAGTAEKVK